MEQKQADQLLMINSSKLAPEFIETIRTRLVDLEYTQAAILFSNLKDPTTALILSVVVGTLGIDRFYIGDIGMGVGKLLVGIIVGTISCGTLFWVWWLIDIFLISNATRKKNSEALLQSLSMVSY
ncbi:MAG: TM2 domain-containing protein [Prevotella sp.]|nr:TM2 domain-containing protein [Prevotella sp.]